MDLEVFLRRGQSPRRIAGISLVGDSLPVRLRSVTVGIVGLVAAVGLGLVAMIYQQSWPAMLGAPLPEGPAPAFAHNDAIAVGSPQRPAIASVGGDRPEGEAASRVVAVADPGDPNEVSAIASPPRATQTPPVAPPQPPIDAPQVTPPPVPEAPGATPGPPIAEEPAAPPVEGPPPPVSSAASEDSPGNSGEAPGRANGNGPPPWAGSGKGHSAEGMEDAEESGEDAEDEAEPETRLDCDDRWAGSALPDRRD